MLATIIMYQRENIAVVSTGWFVPRFQSPINTTTHLIQLSMILSQDADAHS